MSKELENLEDVIRCQCSHGNWNYDPYMHGMANGLILAKSIFTNEEPKYLEAPNKWLCDSKDHVKVVPSNDVEAHS